MNVPRVSRFRMPAEWALHTRCWMLWPERCDNWRQSAKFARQAFANVARAISQFEEVMVGVPSNTELVRAQQYFDSTCNVKLVVIEANDCWVRDSGPTFLVDDNHQLGGVNWQFNAWGNLYDDFSKDQQVATTIMNANVPIEKYDANFVMEGGSIHVDGEGTLLTTEECLLNSNRNPSLTKDEIEEHLKNYLNVDAIIWLPNGLIADEDTNGHIDNFCCFFKPGHVLLAWTDDELDPQYDVSMRALQILQASVDAKGRHLQVTKIPVPPVMRYTQDEIDSYVGDNAGGLAESVAIHRQAGDRLAGSYVNFYIANGGIICPSFDAPTDAIAAEILQNCFPNHRIVQVPGREILLGGGNIHCITQQQPMAT